MSTRPPSESQSGSAPGSSANTQRELAAARAENDRLEALGNERDGVRIVYSEPPWRRGGSVAEKRTERRVKAALALSVLFGIAFVAVFLFWPSNYAAPGAPGATAYQLYTPALGVSFSASVAALAFALISYAHSCYPTELAVQHRESGPSPRLDRDIAEAHFTEVGAQTGLGRRRSVRRLFLAGTGVFAAMLGFLALGGFVRNPWRGRDRAALWTTGWAARAGETVYLRAAGADPTEITLVRPDDMEPGAMQTVYPFRDTERGHDDRLIAAEHASDNPVMLIRLPADTRIVQRPGQEDFHFGEFYAFSKLCTHLGCPASLYDRQRAVALCPCHQSEFLISEYARPIFGPATRPLPQLPIGLGPDGRFIARGDFVEPVGPGFWEMRTRHPGT